MRVLALDAALGWCAAVLMQDGQVIGERAEPRAHGQAELLPLLVEQLLAGDTRLDLVAATIGPGSFTGLRAAISLAHGLAIGAGAHAVGITVPQAIRHTLAPKPCWVVIPASRDRIFLDRGDTAMQDHIELMARAELPQPPPGMAVAGDITQPLAYAAAQLVVENWPNETILKELQPLYMDAPAIKRGDVRPAPV